MTGLEMPHNQQTKYNHHCLFHELCIELRHNLSANPITYIKNINIISHIKIYETIVIDLKLWPL